MHRTLWISLLLLPVLGTIVRAGDEPKPIVSHCQVKVLAVRYFSRFEGTAFLTHFDPNFVVTVELINDCRALDKKAGEKVNLAIHSVVETFLESMDQVTGKTYRIEIEREVVDGRTRFWVRPDFRETASTDEKQEPETK